MTAAPGKFFIRKIPIGQRVFYTLVLLLLLTMLVVAIVVINGLRTLQETNDAMTAKAARMEVALAAESTMWQMRYAQASFFLDPQNQELRADYTARRNDLAVKLNELEQLSVVADPDSADQFAAIQQAFANMSSAADRSFNLVDAGEQEAAIRNELQFSATFAGELAALLEARKAQDAAGEAVSMVSVLASRQRLLWTLLGGLGLFMSGTMAIIISRTLVRPVRELVKISERFANGDFSIAARVAPDEIGQLAAAFNQMGGNLQASFNQLQNQTQALRISADVSRQLTTILQQEQLVVEVVEQIRNAFGFYHVHIYLVEDNGDNLKMAGGTGTVGQELLAANHRLRRDQGLVGQAATRLEPVLIPDVSREPAWLPNPLLPETLAELAVPLIWRGELLGVLDVQHNLVHGLTVADQELLQTLGNQIAVALQNARSYNQTQQHAERELRINTISQKIQSAKTIDNVLKTAIAELGQTLALDQAAIKIERLSQTEQEQLPQNGGPAQS